MSPSERDELELEAYLDGELDAVAARSFELRLEAEPGFAREIEGRRALRQALRADRAEDVPSADLRRRIVRGLDGRAAEEKRRWPAMAASFLLGAVLAGGLAVGTLRQQGDAEIADQVVSAHIRGLMAAQATDVLSSDHHTIRPWFNGKIAFAPNVADLGSQGFPLVGARIDVIGLTPASTLVYSHGKHLISLTEMPNAGAVSTAFASRSERGYLTLAWSDGGVSYWAVSDTAPEELKNFVDLFRAATKP